MLTNHKLLEVGVYILRELGKPFIINIGLCADQRTIGLGRTHFGNFVPFRPPIWVNVFLMKIECFQEK